MIVTQEFSGNCVLNVEKNGDEILFDGFDKDSKDIDSFMERYDSKNDAGNICLYGVNENYFDENKIKISEGRNFQPYEKGKIIINENSYQVIDGEPIPIEIGDIISLPVGIISDRRPEYFEPEVFLEYEVIGKYRERKTDILSSFIFLNA